MTVNVDDGEVREVVAPGQLGGPLHPSWSPDRSSILVGARVPDLIGGDIYTVRSDGTGLHPVTSGGIFYGPSWTRDDRIVFIRWASPGLGVYHGDPWVMDADGGNARRLETTIPALSAAGCRICAYPYWGFDRSAVQLSPPLRMWEMINLLWQPVPADQP